MRKIQNIIKSIFMNSKINKYLIIFSTICIICIIYMLIINLQSRSNTVNLLLLYDKTRNAYLLKSKNDEFCVLIQYDKTELNCISLKSTNNNNFEVNLNVHDNLLSSYEIKNNDYDVQTNLRKDSSIYLERIEKINNRVKCYSIDNESNIIENIE